MTIFESQPKGSLRITVELVLMIYLPLESVASILGANHC